MNAFIVDLENKPGSVAHVAEAISERGINILGFAGATAGSNGSAIFMTNDESGTRSALAGAGVQFRELELVTAQLASQPGSLAAATRRLADAGVNIEAALPVGMDGGNVSVAFATSDAAKTRQALGDLVRTAVPA